MWYTKAGHGEGDDQLMDCPLLYFLYFSVRHSQTTLDLHVPMLDHKAPCKC